MLFMPGFDPDEAKTLIGLAANLQGPTPPLPMPPVPPNWRIVFDSPVLGTFDNKWQLWHNTAVPSRFAVVIRGTVTAPGSILADLLSVMIPATGSLTLDGVSFSYDLAGDRKAAVHLGFVLAALMLLYDPRDGILEKLIATCPVGSDIFIAGHSQGAAVATLVRSYLQYSTVVTPFRWGYKTYVFAQPRPGNDHYGCDFERITNTAGAGFRVTNTQDWVPRVPLTFELLGDVNEPNPLELLTGVEGGLMRVASAAVRTLHEHIAEEVLAKHQPHITRLAEVMRAQRLTPTGPAVTSLLSSVVWTFNFVNCGAPIILAGTPGVNPSNGGDSFWQHHAPMYYQLLMARYP